jgi:signal transduction histidine kinase
VSRVRSQARSPLEFFRSRRRSACSLSHPADVLTEAVETFQAQASGSGISLTTEIVPGLPAFSLDAARILQVLCNLLSNALEFTPLKDPSSSGWSTLMTTLSGASVTQVKAFRMTSWKLCLTASSSQPKMIAGGVGLGLFISKCIVQGHGGRIWVKNQTGGGSTFCFSLPVGTD